MSRRARPAKKAGNVTITVIAERAGVTPATVSRALNDYTDIAEATRERIKTIAKEMNYRPSSMARRLARGTVETIAYVLPAHATPGADPFLGELLNGISGALAARDWDFLVAGAASDESELSVYRRLIASGKVSGFILARTRTHDPRVDFLLRENFPFVMFGRTGDEACARCAYLDFDNDEAFKKLVLHMAGLGHRRIGFMGGSPEYNFVRLRHKGYRDGLEALGLVQSPELEVFGGLGIAGGEIGLRHLIEQENPPTAIVAVSDTVALGAMAESRRRGLTIGKDLSIAAYDGIPYGAICAPGLTTMSLPVGAIGNRLTEILLAVIEGDAPSRFQEIWTATLTRRESDGPAP